MYICADCPEFECCRCGYENKKEEKEPAGHNTLIAWLEDACDFLQAMSEMNPDPEGPNEIEIRLFKELKQIYPEAHDAK